MLADTDDFFFEFAGAHYLPVPVTNIDFLNTAVTYSIPY